MSQGRHLHTLHRAGHSDVVLHFVPAHAGHPGNEAADKEAAQPDEDEAKTPNGSVYGRSEWTACAPSDSVVNRASEFGDRVSPHGLQCVLSVWREKLISACSTFALSLICLFVVFFAAARVPRPATSQARLLR